jgi:cysteinyl-tRNA synthetase
MPNEHPPWHGPFGEGKLKVFNSLTSTKVPFIPKDGNKVSFYICGPTVYDSAHLGHARAYVTFDILRRILEDYFNYDVTFIMNITDIDDKIILRARQNFLLAEYMQASSNVQQVIEDMNSAYTAVRASIQRKLAKLENDVKTADSRHRGDIEEAIKGEACKLEAMDASLQLFTKRSQELKDCKTVSEINDLFTIAKDVLSKKLDDAKGASVTDQQIYREHTAKYEQEFLADMVALGVRPANVLTRVTEYVSEIIEFVQKIIKNGFAYETEGSIYFDVTAFQRSHNYGKLAPWAVGNENIAAEGEGALAGNASGKRSNGDFALWKASKPGEPRWQSPWGEGRPGWHIECSAMCSDVAGDNVDIHAGGEDLKFPHHDNELAQCEAHSLSQQWVNHFWHAGHLNIQGLKMSKSLKNFITIGDVLKQYSARQLRILFLLQPWDKPMNFANTALEEAKTKESIVKHFFGSIKAARRMERSNTAPEKWNIVDRKLHTLLENTRSACRAALEDNFDYPRVMTQIFELISATNIALSESPKVLLLCKIAKFIDKYLRMFGVMGDDDFGFSTGAVNREEIITNYMNAFATFRSNIRRAAIDGKGNAEILAMCDDLRENIMPELGVMLEDLKGGASVWKLDDPATLIRAREQKKAEKLNTELQKLNTKLLSRRKEVAKWEEASQNPVLMFQNNPQYSEFDATGMPGMEDGKTLNKSAQKKLAKLLEKQVKSYASYQEKLAQDCNFFSSLQSEVQGIEADFRAKAGMGHAEWTAQLNTL